jgi:uncharacterized membrane protein (DUF485 family)
MTYNARLGLIFFAIYAAVYAGFIGVCTFDYEAMGKPVFDGINLAIVYGMALILLAIVMAVIYMLLAKNEPEVPQANATEE